MCVCVFCLLRLLIQVRGPLSLFSVWETAGEKPLAVEPCQNGRHADVVRSFED